MAIIDKKADGTTRIVLNSPVEQKSSPAPACSTAVDVRSELLRCIRNAREHIQYEAYNDALSSLLEAEECIGHMA